MLTEEQKKAAETRARHNKRLLECRWRRDLQPIGACAKLNEQLGWVAYLDMDACDRCWNAGADEPDPTAVKDSIIASMKEKAVGKVPVPAVLTIAGKHLKGMEQSAYLLKHAAYCGTKAITEAKLPQPLTDQALHYLSTLTEAEKVEALSGAQRWAEVQEDWAPHTDEEVEQWSLLQKGAYFADALRSGWLNDKVVKEDADTLQTRRVSCFGNLTQAACPSIKQREDGRHYCGDCGCGPKDKALLDGEPSKLHRRRLRCPRRRPGFTNALPVQPLTVEGLKAKVAKITKSLPFDRVVVVNLYRRPDRKQEMQERLEAAGLAFSAVEWFPAVDGKRLPSPMGWRSGSGAWGCMQSHRQVLERAIMDEVGSLLVLEDDADFGPDFLQQVQMFLYTVPPDWEQLMLGGQHIKPAIPLKEGVVRCVDTQRTHAYAIRGQYMKDLYQLWCSRAGHCDHIMGPFQTKRQVYAPSPFIVAQGAGKSDITGRLDAKRNWSSHSMPPVVVLQFEEGVNQRAKVEEFKKDGFHIGYWLDEATGMDRGVLKLMEEPAHMRTRFLKDWWNAVRREAEAIDMGVVCLWHPHAPDIFHKVQEATNPATCLLVTVGEKTTPSDVREKL
jgi:hypothetical protein